MRMSFVSFWSTKKPQENLPQQLDQSRPSNRLHQSGQIAVVILLITVVLMTIGLSLVTRTTQEIFLSQQESESARVFNAAEAGVEDALSQDFTAINSQQTITPDLGITDTSVEYTINPATTLETTLSEGAMATVALPASGTDEITIEWAKDNEPCNNASLLISLYYTHPTPSDHTRVWHEAIAPVGCERVPDDEFDNGDLSGNPTNNFSDGYFSRYTLDISDTTIGGGANITPLFARIRPIYAAAQIRVSGSNLPIQQYIITSTGNNDLGDEQRTIEVQRSITSAPSIVDFALFSGGDILK